MHLLILGASVRAAAQSARRAGFDPLGVDLFADRDLLAVARAERIAPADYPHGLEALADRLPPCPWMYTGALENHPELVDRIAAKRPLLGISGAALRGVRDPIALQDALKRGGLPSLGVTSDATNLPRDGSWLVKPLASAGGRRIHPLNADEPSSDAAIYFQERIGANAVPYSSLFVGWEGGSVLVGTTRQLLGRPGAPFAYRGSVGPIDPAALLKDPEQLPRIGKTLRRAFGLRGVFGVDWVARDGDAFAVEVNPRYTASAEILEAGLGRSLVGDHARAFGVAAPAIRQPPARRRACFAKEILFAEAPCRLPISGAVGRASEVPTVADIPADGLVFDAGMPILTVLSRGASPSSCEARLRRLLEGWRSRLVPIEATASEARCPGSSG